MKLDKKDMQLLYMLDIDGRTPHSKLAKKTGMSKQRIKYRVERLERGGIIKGYYAMIDSSRLGYTTFRVYLKFRNLTPAKKKEIVAYLKTQESIWAVVMLAGKWDIALGIAVEDIYQFHEVWDDLLRKHLISIKDYKISVYSPIHHFAKAYLLDKKDDSKIRILGGREKEFVDGKNAKILLELSKNARISLLELAKHVNLSAEACSARIKRLEKKEIIQGYRALIDVAKLGYEFYKTEIRLADYSKLSQIMEYGHRHPNIYQIDKTIGGETLEVEFHVKSLQEMLQIIDELEKLMPGMIESFNYLTVLSEEKLTYMPK